MMITVFGAVGVYYILSIQKGLSETVGMVSGIATAILLAGVFCLAKKRKG
jgi:hypothetical protein